VRVAFLGAFDPAYPRNVVLREGLEARGAEVRTLAIAPRARPVLRDFALAAAWAGRGGGADAILVPAFGHRDVPVAALLSRLTGAPVLFDPLVSRWDTQVGDLARCREGSAAALRLRASDRTALRLAHLVLCDTWEHGDLYSGQYRVPRRKLWRVPVGADHEAFRRGARRAPRASPGPVEIVYVGGFLPLHGVDTIVAAAGILESKRGPRFARFTLVGEGMTARAAERDIAARGLRSVRRVPRVPYPEALDALERADIALGIFGTTPKAGRVVPHKVFQALALGVPTVTRRSAALAELFRDGEHVVATAAGDPRALAAALEELAEDPGRRARLGAAGRQAAVEQASPERIGDLMVQAVERARELTAPRMRR
jgi:glycosyltransferase involved in cell wall biosynthesis